MQCTHLRNDIHGGTGSDMQLNSWQWNDLVVGRVSKWIDLDSPSAAVRKVGTKVLRQETAWATHLSLPAVLLPSPRQECFNYAAVVSQVVLQARHLHAWIEMPLGGDDVGVETTATTGERPSSGPGSGTGHDPWRTWNTFRTLCDSSPNLHVALVAGKVLPKQSALDRWIGEPVRALVLPTNVFVLNRKGYPTLPDAHKRLVLALFKHKVQFVLSGRPRGTTASAALGTEQPQGHEKASLLPYQMYLSFLVSRGSAGMTQMEQYEAPYLDQLQAPLQPLMDNLESQTYEVSEIVNVRPGLDWSGLDWQSSWLLFRE
jgi:protein arginine N-methyltransferase 5